MLNILSNILKIKPYKLKKIFNYLLFIKKRKIFNTILEKEKHNSNIDIIYKHNKDYYVIYENSNVIYKLSYINKMYYYNKLYYIYSKPNRKDRKDRKYIYYYNNNLEKFYLLDKNVYNIIQYSDIFYYTYKEKFRKNEQNTHLDINNNYLICKIYKNNNLVNKELYYNNFIIKVFYIINYTTYNIYIFKLNNKSNYYKLLYNDYISYNLYKYNYKYLIKFI